MMVMEEGTLPQAALPVQELRDQLGLGAADAGTADGLLATHLRAAMAAIEARTGKVLIRRNFRIRMSEPREDAGVPLPLAPVSAVTEVAILAADRTRQVIEPALWRLAEDLHRPRLVGLGGWRPVVTEGGALELTFTAGFAPDWAGLPSDLRQAVMLLAARYHEDRAEGGYGGANPLPFGVTALIEPYRAVRILGGRGRR